MTSRSLFALILLAAAAWPVSAGDPLAAKVEAVLKTPGYAHAHWGLLVVDSSTGKVVYEKNADQMFCPASVTKLFSTAAALVDLGPDHAFKTPVVHRGRIDDKGVLFGDLILVASGDLNLGGRAGPNATLLFEDNDHIYTSGNNLATLVPADPLAGLDELAKRVHAAGVKTVTGDVLVDDRLFAPAESTGSGPTRLTPIMVNDNLVDVVVTPGASAGDRAKIRLVPDTAFIDCDSHVDTVDEGGKPSLTVHTIGPRAFSIRGHVPVGHKPVVRIFTVEDPASFARALFIEALRRHGVRVDASPLGSNVATHLPSSPEVARLPKLAEFTSPPLKEATKVILKVSHNLHASTLPLLLAAKHGETTLEQGLRRQGRVLKEALGVDTSTISFGGGAGGSRADLVTPRATVALLLAMAKRPEWAAYEAGFPVLGKDGTLAKAVGPDSPARGRARAKTGTYGVENHLTGGSVINSKALAGVIDAADGRKLTFAFYMNNVPIDASGVAVSDATSAAGRVLGKLCEVFYQAAAEPASADASR